jgi:hypothetical protein
MSPQPPLHPPQQHKHERRTDQPDENLPQRVSLRTSAPLHRPSPTQHLMLQLDKPLSNRWHAPCTMLVGQSPQLLFEWTDAVTDSLFQRTSQHLIVTIRRLRDATAAHHTRRVIVAIRRCCPCPLSPLGTPTFPTLISPTIATHTLKLVQLLANPTETTASHLLCRKHFLPPSSHHRPIHSCKHGAHTAERHGTCTILPPNSANTVRTRCQCTNAASFLNPMEPMHENAHNCTPFATRAVCAHYANARKPLHFVK